MYLNMRHITNLHVFCFDAFCSAPHKKTRSVFGNPEYTVLHLFSCIYLFVCFLCHFFFFSKELWVSWRQEGRFLAKIWRRPLFILLHFPFSLLSQETSHSWGSSCCDVPPGLYLNLNSSFSPFFSSIAKKLNGKSNLNQLWNKKWFSNFIGGEIMI